MKREVFNLDKEKGHIGVIEHFESLEEYKKVVRNRPVNESYEGDYFVRVRPIKKSWHGVESYEEAWKKFEYGEDARQVDKFKKTVNQNIKTVHKNTVMPVNSVQGFAPNVAHAIIGHPESMINYKTTPKKSKIVDLIYFNQSSCGVTPKKLREYSAEILKKVIELETNGYRVQLRLGASFTDDFDEKFYGYTIMVKRASETLNLKKLTFLLTNSGFFRVIGFEAFETLPENIYISGHGLGMEYYTNGMVNDIKKYFHLNDRNTVLIRYGDDLNEINKVL